MSNANLIILTAVIVLIERDAMTKIPSRVYEHEVALLQEIHGEDKVHEVERFEVYAPEDFTASDEYERLRAVYDRRLKPGQPSIVAAVWGKNPSALASQLGIARGSAVKRVLPESEQIIRDPSRVGAGVDGLVSDSTGKLDKDSAKAEASTSTEKTAETVAPKATTAKAKAAPKAAPKAKAKAAK